MENKEEVKTTNEFIHNGMVHSISFKKRSGNGKWIITRDTKPMAWFTTENDRDIVFEYLRKFWTQSK